MAKKKEAMTVDDRQNFVIDDKYYDAAIIPETKRELWRRISLRNETTVGGAVLCGNLEIHTGPCTIEQSVLVNEEITVTLGPESGRSGIHGCVQSGRNMVVEVEDDQEGAYLAVLGDVYSKNVNLSRCVVYGNIYSDTAIIRNSVVVGSVYSRQRLEVSDSVIGQYLARSVKIGASTHLLHPVSASENQPDFEEVPDFLLLPESEEEEPVVIPFTVEDIVDNALDFNEPDAILPNHVIGLGMRMLNAAEVEAMVRNSAEHIARVLIKTTSQEEGVEERRPWEERMLDYTTQEFEPLDSTTFSLTDVALPDVEREGLAGLLAGNLSQQLVGETAAEKMPEQDLDDDLPEDQVEVEEQQEEQKDEVEEELAPHPSQADEPQDQPPDNRSDENQGEEELEEGTRKVLFSDAAAFEANDLNYKLEEEEGKSSHQVQDAIPYGLKWNPNPPITLKRMITFTAMLGLLALAVLLNLEFRPIDFMYSLIIPAAMWFGLWGVLLGGSGAVYLGFIWYGWFSSQEAFFISRVTAIPPLIFLLAYRWLAPKLKLDPLGRDFFSPGQWWKAWLFMFGVAGATAFLMSTFFSWSLTNGWMVLLILPVLCRLVSPILEQAGLTVRGLIT